MPPKDMPKEVSIMGGCPVPNLCSPLLYLAELEAEGKAKKARLRAQQRGRVAKGKKGRFGAALRHLWGKTRPSQTYSERIEVCGPPLPPHTPIEVYRVKRLGKPGRSGESYFALRPVPSKGQKG